MISVTVLGNGAMNRVYIPYEEEVTETPMEEGGIPTGLMDTESILTWINSNMDDGNLVVIGATNYTIC